MPKVTERLSTWSPWVRVEPTTGAVSSREFRLEVTQGADAGLSRQLEARLVVGSGPEVHLQLTDPAVSAAHLELVPRAGGVQVRDLGSTNGTFVGNLRVQEAFLERGTTLTLGRTELKLDILERDLGVGEAPAHFGAAFGETPAMRHLFALLSRVALSDSPVVLLGETGTGKEVLAQAIHDHSRRRAGPFVVFDCGAVAPSLIESELFGHLRGAFTGASTDRKGAFLQADKGTLFLDEIGELPLELQPRLLRALEAGMVRRLGEDTYRTVDVRIVAATHRRLETEVKEGRFRQDLFFRLAVALARIPPLRERVTDLPGLVHRFLKETGKTDFELRPELLAQLTAYSWPGNVRELRNVVARALMGEATPLLATGSPLPVPRPSPPRAELSLELPFKEAKERLVDGFTRDYLAAMLERHGGNITRTAQAAGLARPYLHKLVVRLGLTASDADEPGRR